MKREIYEWDNERRDWILKATGTEINDLPAEYQGAVAMLDAADKHRIQEFGSRNDMHKAGRTEEHTWVGTETIGYRYYLDNRYTPKVNRDTFQKIIKRAQHGAGDLILGKKDEL